jgi:hypothetical protein
VAKWEQDTAERIAASLHNLETLAKAHDVCKPVMLAIARHHKTLHDAACEHAETLGIEVGPLSGGTPKELP